MSTSIFLSMITAANMYCSNSFKDGIQRKNCFTRIMNCISEVKPKKQATAGVVCIMKEHTGTK